MARSSDSNLAELASDLRARVAAYAPDWTEPAGGDPGLTIVELFGFLTESLLQRPDASPRLRRRIRELLDRLERSDPARCPDATLSRTSYFEGRLLTAADLRRDQEYLRSKQRRHNRLLHGVGIVQGLEVTVEPAEPDGEPAVRVSAGVAIGPDGEELVLCDPATAVPCRGKAACYVVLRLVERETAVGLDGEVTSVEESAGVEVVEDATPAGLVIARLVRVGEDWQPDGTFAPARSGG